MRFSVLRDAFILCAIFGGMWYLFTKINLAPDLDGVTILPIEQEKKLGGMLLEHYLTGVEQIKDDKVDEAIEIIEERLVAALDSTEYTYNIVVVDVADVNAFATLGGNIVVFRGLMELADSPEEVAAVLAHEIGHVEERHVVNKLAAELGMTAVIALLSNGDPILIQQVLKALISSSFSRSQESDADDFAFELLSKANISASNFGSFFERMKSRSADYPEELEMVMTHPHSKFRIEAAYDYADKNDVIEKPMDIDWQVVKDRLAIN